jgi:hypothetical protein
MDHEGHEGARRKNKSLNTKDAKNAKGNKTIRCLPRSILIDLPSCPFVSFVVKAVDLSFASLASFALKLLTFVVIP